MKSQDLYAQLSQFEPRVTSMREIADQVFAHSSAADSAQLRSKLAVLFDRLSSLLRVCGQYKQLLESALRNRGASVSPSTPALNVSPPGTLSPFKSVVVLSPPEVAFHSFHAHSFQFHSSFCCYVVQTPRSPSPKVARATSMDERTFSGTAQSKYVVFRLICFI